jgi:anaerobic selenocysteine-containing dehydrogenase
VDNRVVKIRGNPNSKVNVGASCPRSNLGIQELYDPDRVKTPMKRTNPQKGRFEDPKFVPISWDEALDTIANKLLDLRKNNETYKYMLMRGRYSYMRDLLYSKMTKIIGSPNNISHSAICAEAEKFGPYFTEGEWSYRQYDIMNSNYILLWGADPISANRQVSNYLAKWGDMLDNSQIAVIDPRLSASASKASEWLPVIPGNDGALALAMAHVILTEGLWYKEFVGDFNPASNIVKFEPGKEIPETVNEVITFEEKYVNGLIKWWNSVVKDTTPEWASEKAGIPVDQIIRVAKKYGKAAPHAISWVGGGATMQPRGAYNSLACHALNGLVGSVDNIGGTQKANKEYSQGFNSEKPFMDEIAKAGTKHKKIDHRGRKEFPVLNKGKSGGGVVTNNAADGIINEDPNEIKVLISYMANFAFSCTGSERWERALAKIPFSVDITTNASELSMFADIILPSAHHQFEKYGFVKSHANGYRHVTMNQKVIKPFWDVRIDETEVPYLIAEKLSEKGFSNLLDYYNTHVDPETGKPPQNASEFALYSLKHATQGLWDPNQYKGGDKFNGWEHFKEIGVWNSDPYPFKKRWGKMKTVTGNFEFYSETLKKALESHAEKHSTTVDDIMETTNYQARDELAFMPHYEEPKFWSRKDEYPLIFVDFKSRFNREGRSANCPWYYDMKGYDPGDVKGEDVARINPVDAKKFNISNGDDIKIISKSGEISCKAKLWEGVRPGTLSKSYGQGHWAYGAVASLKFGKVPRGGNNNVVIHTDYDRLSGSSARHGFTRVKVEKIYS